MARVRPRAFDVAGVLAVVFFVAVVWADLDVLRSPVVEASLEISAEELSQGYRDGVSWYGFYIEENKVGFSRMERRRSELGYDIEVQSLFRPSVLGRITEVGVDLTAECDSEMLLQRIDLSLISGTSRLSASGVVSGPRLDLRLTGAGMEHRTALELDAPPFLDFTLRPALLANNPEVGQRFAYQTFDPTSLSLRTTEIEYLGRDEIEILGNKTRAHLLRQQAGGHEVSVWVNDLGEVLQEEMPLGIIAIRETEAEATWGMGRGAQGIAAEIGQIDELIEMLGPARAQPQRPPSTPIPEEAE